MTLEKCNTRYHESFLDHMICAELKNHKGNHKVFGIEWRKTSKATLSDVNTFMENLQRIPNSYHEIYLEDDGTITMSMKGFSAATLFIRVSYSD